MEFLLAFAPALFGALLVSMGDDDDDEFKEYEDYLITPGGDTTLVGGAGDDYIRGNFNDALEADTASEVFAWMIGDGNDHLDGGDGDDGIDADLGDTVTGGEGADKFDFYLQPGSVAHVTDFDPTEDSLRIFIDSQYEAGDVTSAEEDGNTVVRVDGQDVLVIEGRTDVSFAVNTVTTPGGYSEDTTTYDDLDGNEADPTTTDVVIERFAPTGS